MSVTTLVTIVVGPPAESDSVQAPVARSSR